MPKIKDEQPIKPLNEVESAVELRLAAFRKHPYFKKTTVTKPAMTKAFGQSIESAKKSGVCEFLYDADDCIGSFFIAPTKSNQTGEPINRMGIDIKEGHMKKALPWISGLLKKHRPLLMSKESELMVMAPYPQLIGTLYKYGFHIEFLVLIGETKTAIKALKKKYGTLNLINHSELRFEPIRTKAHVRASLSILKTEFSRQPEYGWFVNHPKFLASERKNLMEEIKKDHPSTFVITDSRKKVLGYFGATLTNPHPLWGSLGGFTFCFDRSIQGKGLSKFAYSVLLKELKDRKIRCFHGGTSQKPTLKMAKVLERKLFAWSFRTGKAAFSRSYFKY